jgi:hypothetical protein
MSQGGLTILLAYPSYLALRLLYVWEEQLSPSPSILMGIFTIRYESRWVDHLASLPQLPDPAPALQVGGAVEPRPPLPHSNYLLRLQPQAPARITNKFRLVIFPYP